jgi:hypothetical protein
VCKIIASRAPSLMYYWGATNMDSFWRKSLPNSAAKYGDGLTFLGMESKKNIGIE